MYSTITGDQHIVQAGQILTNGFAALDACSTKICVDSTCVYDSVSDTATCKCPKSCPRGGEPVCGSDGITYANECEAKKDKCERKRLGFSWRGGECGMSL